MALPSLSWIAKVGESAARLIPGIGTFIGFITLVFDLGETMLAGGLNWLISKIGTIDTSAFSNASYAAITGIGYGNAVFPLSEAVTIGIALATACLTIVTIRWVKSFIPTVAN